MFWVHLFFTLLAWVAPFLFNWPLLCLAYAVVLLQFFIFKRCLMNERHELPEEDDATFYSHLLERMGFHPNRKKLKFFIRRVLYILLGIFSFIWQWGLGHDPLLF